MADEENEIENDDDQETVGLPKLIGGDPSASREISIPTDATGVRRVRKRRSTAPGGQPSPREEHAPSLQVGSFRSASATNEMAEILSRHRNGTLFSKPDLKPKQPEPAARPSSTKT